MREAKACYYISLSIPAGLILARSSQMIHKEQWPMLLALTLFIAVSSSLVLTVFRAGHLDFVVGAVMAAFIIEGPYVALWALALGTLVEGLIYSAYVQSVFFNITSLTIVGQLSFSVYTALGGEWGSSMAHPVQAFAAAFVFMLGNTLFYAINLHVLGRMKTFKALRAMLNKESVAAYFLIASVGIFLGFAYQTGGWLWALAVAGLAGLIKTILRQYFAALEDTESRAQQLEVVLDANRSALIMSDRDGTILVANREVNNLLGVDPAGLIGLRQAEVPVLDEVKRQVAAGEERVEQVIEFDRRPVQYINWYRAPVSDKQGENCGRIDVFTDVTALKQAEKRHRQLYESIIRVLTAAVDARDSYTHGHSERVSAYSVALAASMNLSETDQERIRYASLLHDIGKLGIDDRVLHKKGVLDTAEMAMMMQHPAIGAEVLAQADILCDLIPGVRSHHEWFSGGGYPDGLHGELIPLDARIICVADTLDAMTSHRSYRPALPLDEAIKYIKEGAGIQFDPEVVKTLVELYTAQTIALGFNGGCGHDGTKGRHRLAINPIRANEMSILYQLSRDDVALLGMDAMLQRCLSILYESVGSHVYYIYLVNQEDRLVLAASRGLRESEEFESESLRIAQQALANRSSIVVDDLQTANGHGLTVPLSRSEAAIPIIAKDSALGAMVVEADISHFFTLEHIHLFESLCRRLCGLINLVRYREDLEFAASHDSLTGTHNHGFFYARLTEEVNKAIRDGRPLSVVLLDINGLKILNDTHGHLAGDKALQEYGRILREGIRQDDTVARYGGDEFVLIMPGADRQTALAAVERLRSSLEFHFTFGGKSIPLPSATWGISSCPEDGTEAAELVLTADEHMYKQKRTKNEGVGS